MNVNILKFSISAVFLLLTTSLMQAQNEEAILRLTEEEPEATTYRVEAFGSAATGNNTPFWMVSNQYGVVPLEAGNGYMRAGAFHQQTFGKGFSWGAGLDLVVAAPRYSNVFVQQAYAELGYLGVQLRVGSKENYTSLWSRSLSSGDMVSSANARPIPEVNFSMPEFRQVPFTKEWLQLKFDFALGKSFDKKYLESFVQGNPTYINDVLWHHKSLFLQIKDTQGGSPFSTILGVRHVAQWGGESTNPALGKQPQSFKDFLRVVVGKSGGAGATASDQINVLGNQFGSFDLKFSYAHELFDAHAYWQHYFEDNSGIEYANARDGLWGLEVDLKASKWVNKVVVEYFNTRYQSGPMHFIDYDRPARGGGADNYYNNGEYTTGVSYFGRGLGSPLITAPEYNEDGSLSFKSNRVSTYHFGAEGTLSEYVDYRVLFSVINGWGTTYTPFKNKKTTASGILDIQYHHPSLKGWMFKGSLAADAGSMYGDNLGFSFSIVKRGILKSYR